MAPLSAPSTPRRSRRHLAQPIVQDEIFAGGNATTGAYRWTSDPIATRSTLADDLYGEDDQIWNDSNPGDTTFYTSYVYDAGSAPGRKATKSKSTIKKGKGKQAGPIEYHIGDTVLVTTMAKEPSVAVITGMWMTAFSPAKGEEDNESEDEEAEVNAGEERPSKIQERMVVRLHWFTRPKELARVRSKRTAFDNEVYYNMSSSALATPSIILRHCSVSSSREDAYNIVYQDDEVDEEAFVCFYATNPARGLYYEFDWAALRTQAIPADSSSTDAWTLVADDLVDVDQKGKKRAAKKKGAKKGIAKGIRQQGDGEPPSKRRRVMKDADTQDRGDAPMDVDESSDDCPPEEAYDPNQPSDASSDEPMDTQVSDDEGVSDSDSDEDDHDREPRTPSKRGKQARPRTPRRRKNQAPTTPSRKGRQLAAPTPHSKAALRARKRSIAVRPPPPQLSQEHYRALSKLPKDPWLRAMHVLHVAARPDELPCRDEEYSRILRSVRELVEEGSGGCVYISGVPGTGKTATVHAVVRELKRMAENDETDPFTYVEINGLRIPEPAASYALLWEAVSGHDVVADGHLKISSKEALKSLTKYFGSGRRKLQGPSGHACVVLMDELDQLVTAKQDVVYNFFNWPTLVESRLIVIAVANTMDLPERVMTGRVRSRLGMIRINFQPYTTPQLEKIVHARLNSAKESLEQNTSEDVIRTEAVKFAAMKVSSISGDARRVLDICRRAVEEARPAQKVVTLANVNKIVAVMQNSPTAAYLRECTLHERLMLASLLRCVRKAGVEEIRWGDVVHQHLIYSNVLIGDGDPTRRPTPDELMIVLESLTASRALLLEDGAAVARKPQDERRCVLNLEQGEVERVLGDVGGQRWKAALAH